MLAACKSSAGPSGGTTNAPMSATVDGVAWSSPAASALYRNQIVSIAGIGGTRSISVTVGLVTGAGTFSLGYPNQRAASGGTATAGFGWSSNLAGGTGTTTITTLTANRVVGTFSFDAVPATQGATGTVRVTNGRFDITF